jgi:5-methyltetrahydropteroyltriglutamate--homocysteine methyltransferase
MTTVRAATNGYFPRPDHVIETLKDVEGYQKGDLGPEAEERVGDVFEQGREELIALQRDAGIAVATEGQLSWDDITAYPATRIEGVAMGGITRYYDNNRFYREPQYVDAVSYGDQITVEQYRDALEAADEAAVTGGDGASIVKAVMAGPYTLARMGTDEHYGDAHALYDALADVVNEELSALDDEGADLIQLDEPSLTGVNEDGVDVEGAAAAVERAVEGVDADVVVTTYFGAIQEAYPALLDAGVDGVGLDLVAGEQGNLAALREHGAPDLLAVGAMDARNTRVESLDELTATAEGAVAAAEEGGSAPGELHVAPNSGLDFLPYSVMEEKLPVLGEAAAEVSV